MLKFFTNVSVAKDDILLCGYENGQKVIEKIPYKPYLFTNTGVSQYRTIDGKPVGKMEFDSIGEAKDFITRYKDVNNFTIHGMTQWVYPFIFDNYPGEIEYDSSLISVVSLDIEVDIANDQGFPDVEVAGNEITLITISRNGFKTTLGCQSFTTTDPNVRYIQCKNEQDLLERFIRIWNSKDYSPDIVTGWNIQLFDIPYIINRIIRVLGRRLAQKLSPWDYIRDRKIATTFGKDSQLWEIIGVTILDYMDLYKKFGYSIQESYSLDHIAFVELGERKLDYGEYGSLAELQVQNWQKYTEYNIHDVALIDRLEAKLKLIELVIDMAYSAKINFQDTFTTVRLWDVIIHNYLLEQNIVVPPVKVPEMSQPIIGGYVRDPQVGLHNWVVSFDLTSLYPHIIMQYNISPDTFFGKFPFAETRDANRLIDNALDGNLNDPAAREFLTEHDVVVTANGICFRKDVTGFMPSLMLKYFDKRTEYKNEMIRLEKQLEEINKKLTTGETAELLQLKTQVAGGVTAFNNKQMSRKIMINAAFGAQANSYFRFYRPEFAEAITSTGQLTTRWIERALNEYFNTALKTENVDYVIACDTDSVLITMEKLVDTLFTKEQQKDTAKIIRFLDDLCVKKLYPYIAAKFGDLQQYMNAAENKMHMKRECIASKGIWTAKKRYILNVYNKEGVAYTTPKLKMMGIEAIRSSTPQVCRDAIKEALTVIMNKDEGELQVFIKSFLSKFKDYSFEEVASPRSVSNLEKYMDGSSIFKKGTPINAKGSLIYNHWIKEKKLQKKYELITSGQKIKYAYCLQPNPLHCSVIAAPGGKLPKELGMDKFIDHYKQYEKSFLEPIKTITTAIGWEVERKATLTDFFVY